LKAKVDLAKFIKGLNTVISFTKQNALTNDPILKISFLTEGIIIEGSSPDKMIKLDVPAEVSSAGTAYIIASSVASLKSSYRKGIIKKEENKLIIMSSTGGRKFSVTLGTFSSKEYTPYPKISKKAKQSGSKVSLPVIQKLLSKLAMVPIIIPGSEYSLLSIYKPNDKSTRIITHDSYRIALVDVLDKDLSIEKELITDFKELTRVVATLSSGKADIFYNKTVLHIKSFMPDKSVTEISCNHNIPNKDTIERSKELAITNITQKPLFSFKANTSVKEALVNALSLSSDTGYIDICVSDKKVKILGITSSVAYKEITSMKSEDVVGEGDVRLGVLMLKDIIRSLSNDFEIRVTSSSAVIKSKEGKSVIHFILPYLSLGNMDG
jgi:hypothetical protein